MGKYVCFGRAVDKGLAQARLDAVQRSLPVVAIAQGLAAGVGHTAHHSGLIIPPQAGVGAAGDGLLLPNRLALVVVQPFGAAARSVGYAARLPGPPAVIFI